MYYTYILRNAAGRRYVGSTDNLRRRLAEHDAGKCTSTRAGAPWKLVAAIAFPNESTASAFERYLKSGSGHAFAKRHFG